MNNIILFDDEKWNDLLPICLTRPIADIRIGILKIYEKWERYLSGQASFITKDFLAEKYPIKISNDNWVINSRWLPNQSLVTLIKALEMDEALVFGDELVATRLDDKQFQRLIDNQDIEELKGIDIQKQSNQLQILNRPFDIFLFNRDEIFKDFELIKKGKSIKSPDNVSCFGKYEVFIEEGATLNYCTLNSASGPIYIGKGSTIMEGSHIRGPFALCEGSTVKMGTKVYEDCTVGPHSKVAGEVSNIVIQAYSNKAHDGYLGNSVIGEWCNLGADTNSSNLKNNYTEVKLWNYSSKKFEKSGTQFCGIIMGDHSKCGINTMFNTGTVIGVSANIFGSGYPRNFIPSFSWGGASGYKTFEIDKAIELAGIVMQRRGLIISDNDKRILEHIFRSTAESRSWEK